MRLHALILSLIVLGAQAASIPDKKDIERKLAAVVKEVLNKDEVPIDNVSSESELIEPIDGTKDFENNLKKNAQPSVIPVKVVIEDVQPALKDNKEDNEVSPASEVSEEIVREEIDLKNPGPPQRMQHDTQNPEHFEDAQQAIVLKNSEWKGSTQYAAVQKDIKELKETFENQMTELFESLKDHMKTHSVQDDADKLEKEEIVVRSSVRGEEASSTAGGSGGSAVANSTGQGQFGNGPFGGFFQNWANSFQSNLQQLNQTVNSYWSNSTNSSSSSSNNSCDGSNSSPPNFFGWGSNIGQGQSQQGQQSDEPARPGLWQTVQQNVQNFFQGNPQAPAGAQSDTPQPPQPNRPIIQAIQGAIQQAGTIFQRPGQSETPQPQQPSQTTTQEGANVVPGDSKPDGEKQKVKPEQATPQPQQSGPIIQMIGNNPVAQGLAGAVQRIQHTIIPPKPREDVKKVGDKADQDTKAGFYKPPIRPITGDNNDVSSSGIKKIMPEETPEKEILEEPTSETEKTSEEPDKTD